jgi:hypothetical protein
LFCAALVVAQLLLPLGTASTSASGTAPTTAALRICTDCSDYGLTDPSRYRYVILHSWEGALARRLKAQSPNVRVLVYENVSATVANACHGGVDDGALPAGVGYCFADRNHPRWFLTDRSGGRLEFCDYEGLWLMDIGDGAYQRRWLDDVAASARVDGFDGVFLDDVNQNAGAHLCGRSIAKYPTEADYSRAMSGFLAKVGKGLQARGLLALPNIMIRNWWEPGGVALFERWIKYTSGAMQEYYAKQGYGASGWYTDDGGWHNDWSYRQELLKRTEAAGKIFVGLTYAPSDDLRSQRYARASFLADWDGGPSALAFEPTDPEQQDPFGGQWTADLGSPLGARASVGLAWRRNFSRGAVVVNPSTTTQTVELGARFVAEDGTTVTSVTLQPADAAILYNPG